MKRPRGCLHACCAGGPGAACCSAGQTLFQKFGDDFVEPAIALLRQAWICFTSSLSILTANG
jgi:hypothetical protein